MESCVEGEAERCVDVWGADSRGGEEDERREEFCPKQINLYFITRSRY